MIAGGIDGGGTKVECVMVSDAGEILGYGIGGPVNTNFSPVETVVQSFDQAAASALASLTGQQVAVVVAGSPTNPALLSSLITHWFPRATVVLAGEGELVLAAGGMVERGVAVISGTGSLAMARDGWRKLAVGGWGALLGDEGSAYDIGLNALRAVCQADDGRLPPTALSEAVCCWGQIDRMRDLPRVIHGSDAKCGDRFAIAGLARMVAEVAGRGDETAHRLLTEAGARLADQVNTVVRRIGFSAREAFDVIASGGVLMHNPVVFETLLGRVLESWPDARVARARVPPAVGAAAIALTTAGAPTEDVARLFNAPTA